MPAAPASAQPQQPIASAAAQSQPSVQMPPQPAAAAPQQPAAMPTSGAAQPLPPSSPQQPAAPGASAPAQPVAAAAQPSAASASGIASGTVAAAATTAAKFSLGKLIAIIVSALVIVGGGATAAFLTYRAGLWGGTPLPTAQEVSGGSDTATADDVIATLKSKNVKTSRKTVFSGKKKGSFLGYVGHQPGDRIKSGTSVTVQESAGPGVPSGTVGKKAAKVVSTFKSMGVPVHYKAVPVSDTKKKPVGSVVATYPADGQPVASKEKDKGIYIGVAEKNDDAIGVDIVGQDADTVKSKLEKQGYDVTLMPRFSSKKNVGKIAGSDPAPGSTLSEGDSITLYYGIDASGVKDAYTVHDSPETGGDNLMGVSGVAAGQWCNNAGDCITFKDSGDGGDYGSYIKYLEGRDGTKYDEYETLASCDSIQSPYCSSPKAEYLLTGDTGAFELFPHSSLTNYWCGTSQEDSNTAGGSVCNGGRMVANGDYSHISGATYHMQDFYLVVPVGAKLDELTSDGYFDADALAAAKKQKAVDTTRPFLIYRDPKLYDKTTAEMTAKSTNPFMPYGGYNSKNSDAVKMKPAPSDSTVYYMVESVDLDWDELEDANVTTAGDNGSGKSDDASGKTSGKSSGKSSGKTSAKSAKDMSLADIHSALDKGDFSPIAGKYCLKDGSICVTIDKSGKTTASELGLSLSPGDPKSTTLHAVKNDAKTGDGWWDVPSDVGIELMGPETDYQCGGNKGFKACYGDGASYSEAQISKPADFIYVPAGVSSDKLEGLAASSYAQAEGEAKPDSSKPFLKMTIYHMNVPPLDSNVFYLVQ